ncbi:hypothetical protein Hanom_Chr17g01552911 [Helianthus anomalus]
MALLVETTYIFDISFFNTVGDIWCCYERRFENFHIWVRFKLYMGEVQTLDWWM